MTGKEGNIKKLWAHTNKMRCYILALLSDCCHHHGKFQAKTTGPLYWKITVILLSLSQPSFLWCPHHPALLNSESKSSVTIILFFCESFTSNSIITISKRLIATPSSTSWMPLSCGCKWLQDYSLIHAHTVRQNASCTAPGYYDNHSSTAKYPVSWTTTEDSKLLRCTIT